MSTRSLLSPRVLRAVAGCVTALVLAACSADAPNAPDRTAPPSSANLVAVGRDNDLGPALAAQARHTDRLMADRELLGTAVGRLADGRPEITVFAKNASAAARAPKSLDGIPVTVEVTGVITVLPEVAKASPNAKPGAPGGGGGGIKPTDFARPAYIGMSTGRADECAAGTIGARVSGGGKTYALSNNHVYAKERSSANIGLDVDLVYQPGRYDLGCGSGAQYEFGKLADYVPLSFAANGSNRVDAAIVELSAGLNPFTPPSGYGTLAPSGIATANVGDAVQKFGRTTGLTTGVVVGVNVTINVQYSSGVARFVEQVQIRGDKGSFSRSGDSGSLIVTRPGKVPVALLFAGGQTSTFANRIDRVLSALSISSIDRQ